MNQYKNGTLIVVLATIIIAILILMTGRDNDTAVPTDEKAAITKADSSEADVATTAAEEKQTNTEVTDTKKVEKTNTDKSEIVEIAAPQGPYTKIDMKKPEAPANEETNQETTAKTAKQDEEAPKQVEALKQSIPPIWMDQKLGDFKSIEKSDVVFKMMPTNPEGLQGENPNKVITSKSDKFAPTSIPENYNYQQMPMYNGGYYIAPMPSYLMSSTLPESIAIDSENQNKDK